jgi:hypothetical protein
MDIGTNLLKYTISFCVGLFIITYLLKIPHLLTGNSKLVNNYYIDKFNINVPIDYILVLIYLIIANVFIHILKIKKNIYKILIVLLITILISSVFFYYFISFPKTNNFFSIWFNTVGYSAVIYDAILLLVIYVIYLYMDNII